MDEVWNDLSLSSSLSISLRPSSAGHHPPNFQDFLDHLPFSNNNLQLPLIDGSAPATELSLGTHRGSLCPRPLENKRRVSVGDTNDEERHKRLIKNRESADRSRARKQAYTLELEKEVARLKKENARLQKQLKRIISQGYDQLPKKHSLPRTLTAPF